MDKPLKAVWLENGEDCKAFDIDLSILYVLQFLHQVVAMGMNYPPGVGVIQPIIDGDDPHIAMLLEMLERKGLVKSGEYRENEGREYFLLAGFKELM